jgi:flagellar motor switch protein FliG
LNPLWKIRKLDSKTLANLIRNEHPQAIAVVLAHMEVGLSAGILEELPLRLQTDVLYSIVQLESAPPAVLEEIDHILQNWLRMLENVEGEKVGGIDLAAEILNRMNRSMANQVIQSLDEQQQGLADEVGRLMFEFEDLINVDDRSIMAVLKEVEIETLETALRTASDELKERIFRNMSERASQIMKEDLEIMGPVRLRDVEAAQKTIIRIAKRLENEGEATLSGPQPPA